MNQSLRNKLNFPCSDGQFFMCLEDFVKNFDNLDFVHTNFGIYGFSDCIYKHFFGEWKQGINSGGSINAGKQSFFSNPKYCIDLSSQTESQQVMFSLMQTDSLRVREKIGKLKGSREALGIQIYRLKNDLNLNESNLEFVANSGVYIFKREINKMFELNPAVYLVIPSCFKKDVSMKYLLRIFTRQEIKIEQLNGKYQNVGIKLNLNSQKSQAMMNQKATKIVKKGYVTDAEQNKNKIIGMHLSKLDHDDFSQACSLM